MLAHHSPFLQTSLGGAAPHYHPQKPHSVNKKKIKKIKNPNIHSWPWCFPFIAPMKGEPEHGGVSSPRLLFFSQLFLPNFNFHLFPDLFQKRGRRRRRLGWGYGEVVMGGGANESGTLPCDNCHAEWTSPLFIGFWNSIHCLGREVIKGVEIQTLLSCQLSERNPPPPPPDACVCCGVRLLCARRHIRIMASEKCIHSADYSDPAMPLTIVLHRCV